MLWDNKKHVMGVIPNTSLGESDIHAHFSSKNTKTLHHCCHTRVISVVAHLPLNGVNLALSQS